MDILTKIYKWIEKMFQPVQDFIVKNHRSPFLWIGILIGSFIIFRIVYDALNKEK
ncbi:MAG: hypothetical protein PHX03_00005 [Bacilli bacterium]|nr:hypothetical protein [Bacilli bacterium]MDD4718555.1 hypothetical protein [Bacilli bacterium]